MFTHHSTEGYVEQFEGAKRRTMVWGEKTLLGEFHLAAGHAMPNHAHPHEQAGYLISGKLRFNLPDESVLVGPGDAWCIPGDVPHQVDVLEDSVVIEVFAPCRDEFLPQD